MPGLSWLSSYLSGSNGANDDATSPAAPTEPRERIISKLIVYPVKSCKGIEVESSDYGIAGLDYDRRWMLVNADTHKMITARSHPKSFLIEPILDLETQTLTLRIPSQGDFTVPIAPPQDTTVLDGLTVWGSKDIEGQLASPADSDLSQALSTFLETPTLLLHFHHETPRVLGDMNFINQLFDGPKQYLDYDLEETTTLFADGFPFLVATEESFEAVTGWLQQETTDICIGTEELIKRYRPNIVVRGAAEAFEEDGWEEMRCVDSEGQAQTIYTTFRCGRCPMPNVSPESGTMSARTMPGKILDNHRKGVDAHVKVSCLGMNALPKARRGQLKVGMKVDIPRWAPRNEDRAEGRVNGEWVRQEDTWA